MNKTTSPNKDEAMLGLYALTANITSKPASCPSDENMAAFIDSQLKGKDRRAMLKHLNHCPTCYKDWMASCASIETLQPAGKNDATFWEKMWQHVTNYQQIWTIGLPTAAVSTIIALLVIWPSSNNINNQMSDLYSQNIAHSDYYTAAVKRIPLPWEKTSLGFDLTPLSAATRAYGAGLWKGRANLLNIIDQPLPVTLLSQNNTSWSESAWSDYYIFGRWTVMLWTALESDQEIANWQDYKNIKEGLLANLSRQATTDYHAEQATSALGKIGHLITKAEQSKNQANVQKLIRELKLTLYRLGPDHL